MSSALPFNWISLPLGEVVSIAKGKKPKVLGRRSNALSVPYIDIKAIEKKILVNYTDGKKCTICQPEDVLIVWDGARFGWVGKGPCGAVGSTLARVDTAIDKSYLFHFLKSKFKEINTKPKGVGIPHVNPGVFFGLEFPLPSLPEQGRIVIKIEELFNRLDAGVEAMKQVQAQLKRYRQSVLKAAVVGILTAEWREKNMDELEPADELLERTKDKRKAKLRKKYKEPIPVDPPDLPELPEGWDWTSFSHIGELNRGKSKHRPRNDPKLYNGDYPFVQTGDIRYANKFIRSYSQTYNEIGLKQSRLWPKGTLCITIAANIADTAILGFDACFPDSIVGFTPNQSCNVFFIEYFLRTAKKNLNRYAPATAQKNINLKILSELLIPLPPKIEQDKIIDELDRIFSLADQLDSIIELELKHAQNLRQSILKHAFEGKLVPQDPDDEPASILLERIKAEKVKPKKSKQMEMF